MPEYCATSDVQNRLTAAGYNWVAARSGDGTPSPDEVAAYITTGIQYAGNLIDEALAEKAVVGYFRNADNAWLRDRCVDVAVWWCMSVGGREVPADVVEAKNDALQRLKDVHDNDLRVPGLVYPPPPWSDHRSARVPRIADPCKRHWWQVWRRY
jgi:hypothetical protein